MKVIPKVKYVLSSSHCPLQGIVAFPTKLSFITLNTLYNKDELNRKSFSILCFCLIYTLSSLLSGNQDFVLKFGGKGWAVTKLGLPLKSPPPHIPSPML